MASRHLLRGLPGQVALVLSMLIGSAATITAVFSYFYEGWGQGAASAAGYLVPPVLVVGSCAVATRWPRTGGLVCLVGGLGAGLWWTGKQAAAGRMSLVIAETAVAFFVTPALLLGALFLLEARHRRLLAAEGLTPAARWWHRHHRLVLVVASPVVALLLGPARQLPDMLARLDDGQRGVRTVAGNGVTLTWAPQGPGWNQPRPDGAYPSWDAIASYGGSGAGICGHLSEDGSSLLAAPARVWRLPTAREVVGSLTRGGANARCTWDGHTDHAACAQPPDKETPLWAPDQPPIYYLTSDAAGEEHALGVNYTGGITPHRRLAASRGVGYRCVKGAVTDATRAKAGTETWKTLDGRIRTSDEAEIFLISRLREARIPTLSVAIVQDGRVVFDRTLGVVDRRTRKPVDSRTVLRAASLSKPVFSYLVVRLVDERLLHLDQRLDAFIDPPFTASEGYAALAGDARARALTPAILLTHSAGFPNWRQPRATGRLAFQFDPGTEFSYSGEGYYLLQFLLEKKTRRPLAVLAREKVFEPLGMTGSSFLWESRFDGNFAVDLDSELATLIRRTRTDANAAGSLLTNATDYARFMLAVLSGRGLKAETAAAWRTPRIRVTGKALHDREKPSTSLNDDVQLSWTPGWGSFRSPAGQALFHVGMEEGCENYVVLFPAKHTGIVIQSVSDLTTRVSPAIVAHLIGDLYSPFTWMRY